MRLRLLLHSTDKILPINYNYYLSAAVYKLLKFGSKEFAEFLHDKGFILNGRPYKLFCFALRFKRMKINGNSIHLLKPEAELYISSALVEEFIRNFVIGSFNNQLLEIAGGTVKCTFAINQIESLPEPNFNSTDKFNLLSPIVLSTLKDRDNGGVHQYYFRYNDDINEINRVFNQNLKNKYKLIYNHEYVGENLMLEWDKDYIHKREKINKRMTKKISIEKIPGKPVDIIANEIPFTLNGNSALIKVGYDCGFGEKNSMGFGMAEIKDF